MIFVIGVSKLTNKLNMWIRLLLVATIMFGSLGIIMFADYMSVKSFNQAPMVRTTSTYLGGDEELLYYDTPFYDVIKCNEKFNIVKNKNYTHEELFEYCYENSN
jgi:hypothetical protein